MNIRSTWVRWLVAAVALPAAGHAVGQRLPVSSHPDWHPVSRTDGSAIAFERNGFYAKGDYTYVAVRELDASDPSAYVFMVHAFHCRQRRVSMATLGRMSRDGSTIESAPMNSEKILEKFSDPLPVPRYEPLTEIAKFVCARGKQ